MSEQRLVTLHGGPLDGRCEAWEAGQTERVALRRTTNPLTPPMSFPSGHYRGTLDGGDAEWEPIVYRDSLGEVLSSNGVLFARPEARRPWWRFW